MIELLRTTLIANRIRFMYSAIKRTHSACSCLYVRDSFRTSLNLIYCDNCTVYVHQLGSALFQLLFIKRPASFQLLRHNTYIHRPTYINDL